MIGSVEVVLLDYRYYFFRLSQLFLAIFIYGSCCKVISIFTNDCNGFSKNNFLCRVSIALKNNNICTYEYVRDIRTQRNVFHVDIIILNRYYHIDENGNGWS